MSKGQENNIEIMNETTADYEFYLMNKKVQRRYKKIDILNLKLLSCTGNHNPLNGVRQLQKHI